MLVLESDTVNKIVPIPTLVPCTTELVGLWPVSDEVSPLSSVVEQC